MSSSSELSDKELTALSFIYISFLSLSLIGSFSVVVLSIVKWRHLNEQAKPLLQLALADTLASLVLIGTTIINFLSYEALPSEVLCTDGLPLSLTFYCISFLLVTIYAYESAHTAQGWREQGVEGHSNQGRRHMLDFLYIFVWVIPLMVYLIYIRTISLSLVSYIPASKTSDYGENVWTEERLCNSCFLFLHLHIKEANFCSTVDINHNNFIRGFTFTSVLSVLTCCTLVYWRLQSWYSRYEQTGMFRDSQRFRGRICSSACCMILVIIFCWTPALVLISFSFASFELHRLFPLFVIQALSVSLQGFLNSIVYAWRRQNFREAVLGERLPLMTYANKAFFDQSLSESS